MVENKSKFENIVVSENLEQELVVGAFRQLNEVNVILSKLFSFVKDFLFKYSATGALIGCACAFVFAFDFSWLFLLGFFPLAGIFVFNVFLMLRFARVKKDFEENGIF